MQTGRSQRVCWPTDGCEADAAQPSPAPWKEMAGLTQACSFFFIQCCHHTSTAVVLLRFIIFHRLPSGATRHSRQKLPDPQ